MPKLVCLLAAALMLVSGAATAHSWYPKECCHDKDCHPVQCAELKVTANGDVMWKGVLYFSAPMMRDSLDGQCHVCVEEGLNASVIPYLPICVFVPHATS
jgi:hypothetical protein